MLRALGVVTAATHRLQLLFVTMTLPVYLAMYLDVGGCTTMESLPTGFANPDSNSQFRCMRARRGCEGGICTSGGDGRGVLDPLVRLLTDRLGAEPLSEVGGEAGGLSVLVDPASPLGQ